MKKILVGLLLSIVSSFGQGTVFTTYPQTNVNQTNIVFLVGVQTGGASSYSTRLLQISNVVQVASYPTIEGMQGETNLWNGKVADVSDINRGGRFVYLSASSDSTNMGTIFKPLTVNGRWFRSYSGPLNVRWFGAKGDGTTDDTAALSNALALAVSTKTLWIPDGTYKITSTLSVTNGERLTIEGDKKAILHCEIPNTNSPLISITSENNYFAIKSITLTADQVDQHGHAISLISPSSGYWPQEVLLRDVVITGFKGYGLDNLGALTPTAAVYAWNGSGLKIDSCNFSYTSIGLSLKDIYKSTVYSTTFNEHTFNAVRLNGCGNITFTGCILNAAGGGSANDGLAYIFGSEAIAFYGTRFKNGNPVAVDMTGTATANKNIIFDAGNFEQVTTNIGETCILVGTGTRSLSVANSTFLGYSAFTNFVGIHVIDGPANYGMPGLAIRNNTFDIGLGGVSKAFILLDNTNRFLSSPLIEGNSFGTYSPATVGSPKKIADALYVKGPAPHITILNNAFAASDYVFITNAIRVASASTTNLLYLNNRFEEVLNGQVYTNFYNQASVASVTDGTYGGFKSPYYEMGTGALFLSGNGAPEGAVTAPTGSIYLRTAGGSGTTIYVKETGSGNTGWVGK